jgi:hypothetical protein
VITLRPDGLSRIGEIGDFETHAEFCELLIARMMICATARITGSEEWRKIGKKV